LTPAVKRFQDDRVPGPASAAAACARRPSATDPGERMINDRLIDAGDLPVAVRDFGGDGRPLLLVHGAGDNLAAMTTLARALRPRHRVVTVDLRGHGRSGDGPFTMDAALGDLAAVAVQLGLDRPAVVGHALGGMIAALWGSRHPDSPGVVSLDGTPPPMRPAQVPGLVSPGELEKLHAAFATRPPEALTAEQVAALVEDRRALARRLGVAEKTLVEALRRNLVTAGGTTTVRPSAAVTDDLWRAVSTFDPYPVYAATTCPLLVVLATRDTPQQEPFAGLYAAYRQWVADQVAAAARRAPRMRFVRLADASHAMVDEHPETLARLIGEFLAAR
jgi:pimeloyl-ACP methyl ester carboxylesterase